MASKSSTGSARTEPKGRATAARGSQTGRRAVISPTMEWILAVLAILVILGVLFVIFGDVRSTTHSGAPLATAATQTLLAGW